MWSVIVTAWNVAIWDVFLCVRGIWDWDFQVFLKLVLTDIRNIVLHFAVIQLFIVYHRE